MNKIKLSSICDIQSGGTPSRGKAEFWNGGTIPWVKIGDFTGKHIKQTAEMITPEGLAGSSAKLFPKGTILYTIFATLGEIAILDIDACTNQAIAGLTLHDERIDKEYLVYFLKSLKAYVSKIGRGVAQNNINMSILREFEVPMRSLTEQKQIAQMLLKTEEIITARKQQLSDFDTLIKARFMELFGNPITREKDEELKALGDYCDLKAGKFVKASDIVENNVEGLYPCFGGNGQRGFVSDYTHDGDFPIIGRQGALCGNVQYASGKFHATEHAVVVTPRIEMDRYWLYYLLLQLNLNRYATGAAQPGLAVSNLEKIHVSVPKLSLQKKFADFACQSDKSKYVAPHK